MKRFLKKCGVIATKKLLISIIRRFDLDSDARLGKEEFFEGILPIEKFTKGSLEGMKMQLDPPSQKENKRPS